jgi:hypothetical protein
VTLILSIYAAVGLVRSAVQLAYPDPGYFAFEPVYAPDGKGREVDDAEQERRERAARDSQRHQAVLGLVGSGAMLLIAGPAYVYHWRRVQSEQSGPREVPASATQE